MAIRLRTASVDDAQLLATLGARLFEQTFGSANSPEDMASYLADAFSESRQSTELAEPSWRTWIAEDDSGTAVGYAVLIRGSTIENLRGQQATEIRRIYVDASLHGRSVTPDGRRAGQVLIERCVDQAREWSTSAIWLAVWEENAKAIRFYEKHGFQQVGVKTFQLGSDIQHDYVMARNL
ncbi:MAG TPA: GNAT family N-acetyltransferase [Gemmatimonadaceae bacterium]|jgi:GNAT superfamily N-acetyltransferase